MVAINDALRRIAGESGDVVVALDFFRFEDGIFKVNRALDMMPWKPEEVHQHLNTTQVDRLMLRLSNAMAALHQAGILHCDLKPENVFIVEEDGQYVGKVSDFDDSIFMNDIPKDSRVVKGTEQYLSPELGQYKTQEYGKPLDPNLPLLPASDIFSLGLMYHMYLTGELPETFLANDPDQKIDGQLWAILLGSEYYYRLSDRLDAAHYVLIQQMLSPLPRNRIGSCEQLSSEIQQILSARKTYTLKILCGDAPLSNKDLWLYGAFMDGDEEFQERAQAIHTDANGEVKLKGIPSGLKLLLECGNGDMLNRIVWDANDRCVFQTKPKTEYCVRVLCDGRPAPNQKVVLSRAEDGWKQEGMTDAKGEIAYEDLPEGNYLVSCGSAKRRVTWDENRICKVTLRTYAIRVRRGDDPAANQPISLYIMDKGNKLLFHGKTGPNGLIRFRFPQSAFAWRAVCGEEERQFRFPDNLIYEMKLSKRVKLIMLTTMAGSTTPVEGIKCALYVKENGKPKQLAEGVTGADGRIAFGSFEPGEYYVAALSGPSGLSPKGGAFRRTAKVNVAGDKDPLWIRMEFVMEFVPKDPGNIVSDKKVAPQDSKEYSRVIHYRDGHVILVRPNGSYKHLHSAGELALYGLSRY